MFHFFTTPPVPFTSISHPTRGRLSMPAAAPRRRTLFVIAKSESSRSTSRVSFSDSACATSAYAPSSLEQHRSLHRQDAFSGPILLSVFRRHLTWSAPSPPWRKHHWASLRAYDLALRRMPAISDGALPKVRYGFLGFGRDVSKCLVVFR